MYAAPSDPAATVVRPERDFFRRCATFHHRTVRSCRVLLAGRCLMTGTAVARLEIQGSYSFERHVLVVLRAYVSRYIALFH